MVLSLCMIVKNEEDNLPRCLNSIKDIVDEIIIVDTGSTDRTVEIAKNYGANIFYYEWDNNFSNARNFSIEKAQGDWILIMDADDELEMKDKTKLLELLQEKDADCFFLQTLNHLGTGKDSDIVYSINIRLIRNEGNYRFEGAIHEQIRNINASTGRLREKMISKVRFHHYGYLYDNVIKKDKRKRNISILEKLIKNENDLSFNYFNMGNEYYSLEDYLTALDFYKNSYKSFDPYRGYSSRLIFRIILTLDKLRRYDEELDMINTGLKYYPNFTDLEFLRASLYKKQNKATLAIKSFKKCINMGEAPMYIGFMKDVEGFKSYNALGDIYFDLGDYKEAYNHYLECLRIKPNYIATLYKIAEVLNKKGNTIDSIKDRLEGFFQYNLDEKSLILLGDIFFNLGFYSVAHEYILKAKEYSDDIPELIYFEGLNLLYLKEYYKAMECFNKIKCGNLYEDAFNKIILCKILINDTEDIDSILNKSENFKDNIDSKVYKALNNILSNKPCSPLSHDEFDSHKYLNSIFDTLNIIIKTSKPETFEKSLQLLNLIDNDTVLLKLAKLYYNNNFYSLSFQEFKRSIKLFDKIDFEGLTMMKKILQNSI